VGGLLLQELITERHFTVHEIAESLNISYDSARRLFLDEPGVVVIASPPKKYKRRHRTLRIPESVFERVYRRLRNAA
jgi:hypothetical protein